MRLDDIPLWGILAGTIVVVLIAIEVGYWLGKVVHQRAQDEKESPVSAIAGAILGLTAFMLAFTFGMVWDRHDAKKGLVRDDAIAIGTAWQRSDFLPEADRAEAAALLRRYLDLRLALAEKGLEPGRVRRTISETQRLQDRLWNMAVANARLDMNSDVAALYIESLNQMNAINTLRVAIGIQARIPSEIWRALYGITILGMVSLGYQTGIAESRRSRAGMILALAFAVMFALIASLDRPDSGLLQVTQQPLIDLRGLMAESLLRGRPP